VTRSRGFIVEVVPYAGADLSTNQGVFEWAFRQAYFLDLPAIAAAAAHLLQVLVADARLPKPATR
jgi:hypothetical protein